MRRRDVLAGLMLPLLTRAGSAQESIPIVAFVTPGRALSITRYLEAIRRGLLEIGFVDGRNVLVEHHHFERRFERLPQLLANLIQRHVR
jgi:hypothetical protein